MLLKPIVFYVFALTHLARQKLGRKHDKKKNIGLRARFFNQNSGFVSKICQFFVFKSFRQHFFGLNNFKFVVKHFRNCRLLFSSSCFLLRASDRAIKRPRVQTIQRFCDQAMKRHSDGLVGYREANRI